MLIPWQRAPDCSVEAGSKKVSGSAVSIPVATLIYLSKLLAAVRNLFTKHELLIIK